MPVIPEITPQLSIDQWRQVDNQVITAINNESINEIVQIIDPLNNGDILVYNSTDGFFENTAVTAFVNAIIANLASIPTNTILPYYLSQTVRTVF